jgi:hypothetical protein
MTRNRPALGRAAEARATNRIKTSSTVQGLGRRDWLLALGLSISTVAVGSWGFLVEDPANQAALEVVTYVAMPVLILVTILAGQGRRPMLVLAAAVLIDLEAMLLGGGPIVSLPFVVVIPLVGVSAAVRVLPPSRQPPAYVLAWLASSVGVAIAVFNAYEHVQPSALAVIPCFSIVDALALALLWRPLRPKRGCANFSRTSISWACM